MIKSARSFVRFFVWRNEMFRKFAWAALVFSLPAYAVGPDPQQDWRSADTAHFRINYVASQRPPADRPAQLAESAYARLTKQLHWEPQGKTEVLVRDASELASGYSTPLPFSKAARYLAPPDEGELLDNSNWLE